MQIREGSNALQLHKKAFDIDCNKTVPRGIDSMKEWW